MWRSACIPPHPHVCQYVRENRSNLSEPKQYDTKEIILCFSMNVSGVSIQKRTLLPLVSEEWLPVFVQSIHAKPNLADNELIVVLREGFCVWLLISLSIELNHGEPLFFNVGSKTQTHTYWIFGSSNDNNT